MELGYKCWLENDERIFGKGPYDLLSAIDIYGSINKASVELGISYSKAIHILKRCERHLGFKLLDSQIGGVQGGGSFLTKEAQYLMQKYNDFINEVDVALKHAFDMNFGQFFEEIHGLNDKGFVFPRVLLLTGESGIGKSTIIGEYTKMYSSKLKGFTVQRIMPNEGDLPLGFQIRDHNYSDNTYSYVGQEEWDSLFDDHRLFLKRNCNGEMIRDIGVLEKYIPLYTEGNEPLILDEIGGMELASPKIRELLYECFAGQRPIIGVLKSVKGIQRLNKNTEGPSLSESVQHELINKLGSDVKILEVTNSNKKFIKTYIGKWIYKMMEETNEIK